MNQEHATLTDLLPQVAVSGVLPVPVGRRCRRMALSYLKVTFENEARKFYFHGLCCASFPESPDLAFSGVFPVPCWSTV
jgi:hypothetical protein